MKPISYEKVTIENMQKLYKSGYITEIIFDADNRTISLNENEYLVIEEALSKIIEVAQSVVNVVIEFAKKMTDSISLIFQNLNNKKMTKKKFIKLLRSEGIHQNKINEIVKGNKEPYTYMRYYTTLQNLKR